MSDEELRIFALSNMQLLIITGIEEGKYADKALEAFELIIKRKKGTPEIYEAYILILELTYQYEKSYDLLLSLLHDGNTKELALKFLSSYTYCAEKLQSFSDFISCKKELINMTKDLEDKKKLQKELQIYKND